jgi:hypothetical protein
VQLDHRLTTLTITYAMLIIRAMLTAPHPPEIYLSANPLLVK